MVPTPTPDADFADRNASVIRDFSVPSRALLVAFGGIAGQMEMPPFEFFRHAGSLEVKRMFVRDLDQCWYQTGIRGLGDGVGATAEALTLETAGGRRPSRLHRQLRGRVRCDPVRCPDGRGRRRRVLAADDPDQGEVRAIA